MKTFLLRHALPWSAAVLLAACGGDRSAEPAAPAAAQSVVLQGKAVDGPLQGASACLDLNDNGACDAAEPRSAPSAADGSFSLSAATAEAGRHRVIVEVPSTAIDADTGAAVGTAFTLAAPALGTVGSAPTVFVSPLTTLVQAHMDLNAATLAEATEFVRTQAGLGLSPLADFTAGNSADHRQAALVARLVQLTALAQQTELAAVVGTTDRTGTTVTAADVQRESQRSLLAGLPAMAGAAIDPSLEGSSGAALQASLQTLARAVAAQLGLNAEIVRAGATFATLQASDPGTPVAGSTLVALRYVSADDWSMRTFQASAEDNTPDGQNRTRVIDVRQQATPNGIDGHGVVRAWGTNNAIARAGDRFWNGSTWADCPLGTRWTQTVRDAAGRNSYDYCNGMEQGRNVRRVLDISGQTLLSVVRDRIRTFPGGNGGVNFSSWGPSNLSLYGSAVFPAGSQLIYQTGLVTASAPRYDVQASNEVLAFNAAVSAGGDARSNPSLACNDPAQYAAAAQAGVLTLQTLVARFTGQPCLYAQGGATPNMSLSPNEWWGAGTVSLGTLAGGNSLPANTGNYYDTTAHLRVSFATSGNGASFWRCYRRASDGSPRNCTRVGGGSWRIDTLGDARVLSFSVMPSLAQRLGYVRVFVERGGKVYYGFRSPVGDVAADVRLNLAAANAVQVQLSLPRTRPVTAPGAATGQRAATLALLKGAWGTQNFGTDDAIVFRFGDNGRFFMAEAKAYLPVTQEQTGTELGWLDIDPATGQLSTLLEVDSNLTSGTSHPNPGDVGLTVTAESIGAEVGGIPRLQTITSSTSFVGLWAVESATDLSVVHLAFFANGRAMLIDHKGEPDTNCLGANQCPPGAEYMSYTFDTQTGTLRFFNKLYDTNGCSGLFNSCPAAVAGNSVNTEAVMTATIAADGRTATLVVGTDPPITLHRIAAR